VARLSLASRSAKATIQVVGGDGRSDAARVSSGRPSCLRSLTCCREAFFTLCGRLLLGVASSVVAFLTGVNHMPWQRFLIANAAGAVLWASVFGIGGFFFGKLLLHLHHAIAIPALFSPPPPSLPLAISSIGMSTTSSKPLPGPLKRPAAD
jgi:hypothetical protein